MTAAQRGRGHEHGNNATEDLLAHWRKRAETAEAELKTARELLEETRRRVLYCSDGFHDRIDQFLDGKPPT